MSQDDTPKPEAATKTTPTTTTTTTVTELRPQLRYVRYEHARENEYVPAMKQLISKGLSEPYSIYVYRYFLYQWGDLCFLALDEDKLVGVVVSKLECHRGGPLRGYIAMLAVREECRGRGIATKLVRMAIDAMIDRNADEVSIHIDILHLQTHLLTTIHVVQ
jgi:N-alpha-acetyltransferase 30